MELLIQHLCDGDYATTHEHTLRKTIKFKELAWIYELSELYIEAKELSKIDDAQLAAIGEL